MAVTKPIEHKIFATVATCASLVSVSSVIAETAPDRGYVQLKYLNYKDSQPNIDRISVSAPSTTVMLPFSDDWTIEGNLTSDTISGATPQYHSEKAGMVNMHDERIGRYVNVTKYFSRGTLSLTKTDSKESDYVANGFAVSGTISSEDKNTTLNLGIGRSNDRIDVAAFGIVNEQKQVTDLMIGVTQVISPVDIVQVNLTRTGGTGYYSDPYKLFDTRPDHKQVTIVSTRWNHHIKDNNTTVRTSYRYYEDSFKIQSHTFGVEWVVPLVQGWIITPAIRYYSQNEAYFYTGPQSAPDPTFPTIDQTYFSQDQRLSAFGARTLGLKVVKKITDDWSIDIKYEDYEQRSDWRLLGGGSKGIDPFYAKIWQLGTTYYF